MPRCPSCFTPLTRCAQDEIKSAICGNCFGTWINIVALLRRARKDVGDAAAIHPDTPNTGSQSAYASLADLAEVVQTSNCKQSLRCPQCEKPMQKDRFHPMIPIQIDRCRPCGFVWLDAGELNLLRRLYVELMTSADTEIVRRREKVAIASAAWEGRSTVTDDVINSVVHGTNQVEGAFDLLAHLLQAV